MRGTLTAISIAAALVCSAPAWASPSDDFAVAGDRASDAPRYLFGAMGLGALIQILKSDRGIMIFREFSQGFLPFPRWLVKPAGGGADVAHTGGIAWTTPSLSPALAGIGYIIGPELASINASGGVIAWWLLIPLMSLLDPDLAVHLGLPANASWEAVSTAAWSTVVRPIAVGTIPKFTLEERAPVFANLPASR